MARALRKWLKRNPTGKPADALLYLTEPVVYRSRGQHIMSLGCETVYLEIKPLLIERGVRIIEF